MVITIGGYYGKMLFVDLTNNKLVEGELLPELAQNFIGGYGIGAKVLYEMMPAGADPLGPESVLGFVTGPANGTKAFFGGRYTMVYKSPATGHWSDSNSGGYFGPELKKAGYDAVFISGKAASPVYLWINDGKAEIRNAIHLWGQDTKETWSSLQKETGNQKVRVVAIGPAGEKMSLISCPINDGHRAPARGGGGAVMGSKNLKAIAVVGTGKVPVANPDRVMEINKRIAEAMKTNDFAAAFGKLGTGISTADFILMGKAPTKNWSGVGTMDFGEEKAKKLNADVLDKHKVKKYNCSSCPLGCGAEYEVKSGRWPLAKTERPEYETVALFGSLLLNDQEDVIFKCNEICNIYGLDTISMGGTIAWAMECYNHGILTKEDLDGLVLSWGNGEAIVALTQKIADQDGCGQVLAHGSAIAAKIWGKGAEFLQTASGIELAAHDPKYAPGFSRTYQYDPTPGRHTKGGFGTAQTGVPVDLRYDYTQTGQVDMTATAGTEIINSSGFCLFLGICAPPETINEYIEAITGIPFSPQISLNTGLRILTIRHSFNLREGFKPSDFKLSPRATGHPPQSQGPLKDVTLNHELIGRNFFEAMDWDWQTGRPSLEILKKLGYLDEVIKDNY